MNRIKQLREERGMTQPELGEVLNVQGAAISKYENEKIPLTTETIKNLSDFFRVSTDYLLGKTDEKGEQSEPEYTTLAERQLLNIYRNYTDNGYSDDLIDGLRVFFPELPLKHAPLNPIEDKMLTAFRGLNEDNQDIMLGELKKQLKEQRYEESIRKASGK